jgi:hypothetical protein
VQSPAAERPLRCPKCGAGTFRVLSAVGVELDLCGQCGGAFLDGPEVGAFLRRGRSKQSPIGVVADSIDGVAGVADIVAKIVDAVA